MLKKWIGRKIAMSLIFTPSGAWAGQCEIKEALRDGLSAPTLFDQDVLTNATSLQKCTEASYRSGFLNRYILSYKADDTSYLLISGQIVAINGTVLKQ